jgi:hypothetical protein
MEDGVEMCFSSAAYFSSSDGALANFESAMMSAAGFCVKPGEHYTKWRRARYETMCTSDKETGRKNKNAYTTYQVVLTSHRRI